jgi:hypothetical protein
MPPFDSIAPDAGSLVGDESAAGPDRVLVIACGALAREIKTLLISNRWSHIDLTCLPANLHLHPQRIPDAVEAAVLKARATHDRIFVAYGDCGTGGMLAERCRRLGVEMIEGPHCYSFFDGNAAFAARADAEVTTFFLTDFLVRQFDAFVWKALGLDRHPALLEMYFGNYDRLVYLAQTDDPALDAKAGLCAERLGLSYLRRYTGYGDLQTALAAVARAA